MEALRFARAITGHAGRAARSPADAITRSLVGMGELALLAALWIVAATALSELTTRARDWFAKDDELRYERLAISIARTHSLVPRIHGVDIHSYSQLYPLLIAPFFRHGLVPDDVETVHLANAWIMSSACIPAFFLARRVTGRAGAAYLVAALTVVMPWIVLSSMMLTEVASYPAAIWALLAIQSATASPSRRNDLLALLAIAVAYFARGELIGLLPVLPLAIVAFELRSGERSIRRLLARHDLLAGVYAVLLVAAATLAATGDLAHLAGVYGRYAENVRLLPDGFFGSFAEHMATFSLVFGVIPFVAAIAWLLARAAAPPSCPERHAFAWVGLLTVAAVMAQSTNFDVLYNTFVHDRFMVYLVPVIAIGMLCAALDARSLRAWAIWPALLVAAGFVFGAIPFETWGRYATIDDDAVAGALYKPLAAAFGGLGGARVALVAFTLAGSALLVVPRLRVALPVAALLVVALPATTAYTFTRFLGTDDWASRPITSPQVERFTWVDRTVGRNADVTIATYPVSTAWFVSLGLWRDYQYWNASIDRDVELPSGVFTYSSFWFPKVSWSFDPTTGRADVSLTRYVLEADQESRFRLSGEKVGGADGLSLIDTKRPWRSDWLSFGLYDDGWTRPGITARVRVFALPSQRGPITRSLTFGVRAPVAARSFTISSNEGVTRATASADTVFETVEVCVPARGYADVRLRAAGSSAIPGDQASYATSVQPRSGGVFLSEIALADEVGEACDPRRG